MSVTVAEVAEFERLVTFTVPTAELTAAENAAARRISRELRIPGFRPGRAPRPIVEARVGADRIREEAIDELLPTIVGAKLAEAEVDAAATPSVEAIRDTDDGIEVDIKVAIWPSLTGAPDYVGRQIDVGSVTVDDDELSGQFDALRDQFADVEVIDEPAAEGDIAVLTLAGSKDGEPYEGLSADDLYYQIGSGDLIDGLDDHLPGLAAGDTVSFDGVLPDGFGDQAGEAVTYDITVKEVRRKDLPDVTDEWIAEHTEFDTVDDFSVTLRRRLAQRKVDVAYERFRRNLVDTLADEVEIELPESLVRGEMDNLLHDFSHRLEAQGVSLADYFQVTGQSQEVFLEDLKAQATRSIGVDLVLDAIIDDAGIDLEDDERNEALETFRAMGREQGVDVAGTPQEQRVLTDMLRQKAMQALLKSAVPVDDEGNVVDFTALAIELAEPEDEDSDDTESSDDSSDDSLDSSDASSDSSDDDSDDDSHDGDTSDDGADDEGR